MDGTTNLRRVVSADARLAGNASALASELVWLGSVIEHRVSGKNPLLAPAPPEHDPEGSPYGDVVERFGLGPVERALIALALAPHVRPELLDPLFAHDERSSRGRTEIGGVQGRAHGGFLPTGETALFLLAGTDLRARFEIRALLEPRGRLTANGLVRLEEAPYGEPPASGSLTVPEPALSLLTSGVARRPDFGRDFPARLLTSEMEWNDLVLSFSTLEQLRELEAFARNESELHRGAGLARRLRGGYRALFYGPPGTGKTATAALLGKRVGRDVYRVMLSAVVSKYVGETAKNLEGLFTRAEQLGVILFFDEADALFGKRAAVNDARDRYANQEVSYLLQRVEDHPGIVVLATNFEINIDPAFMRRFHAVVHFPMPGPAERRRLFREAMPSGCSLAPDVDLDALADRVLLSGGSIVNAMQYAALMAFDSDRVIKHADLLSGIRREQQKAGGSL